MTVFPPHEGLLRDHFLLGAIAGVELLRLALAHLRLRLYQRHKAQFEISDGRHVRDEWHKTLANRAQWQMSWVMTLAFCVGLTAVVLFHPKTPRGFRDGFAGCVLYWVLARACVESYYLLNRYLALARPKAARSTARRFPRAGLLVEAMLVAFVALPVAAAAAAERTWFLLGGAVSLGLQEAMVLWRLLVLGRRVAGERGRSVAAG